MTKRPLKLYLFIFLFSLIWGMVIFISLGMALPWQTKTAGIREVEIRSLAISSENPKIAFAGTTNAIYKTTDAGLNWQEVYRVRGSLRVVNFLLFDPQDYQTIYAATDSGLFISNNEGKNWFKIFEGVGNLENICLNLALCGKTIYLATRKGLFFSFDKAKTWQRAGGVIGANEISCVAIDGNIIYLATTEGLYKSQDNAKSWEKIFTLLSPQATEATQDFDFEIDNELKASQIKFITIDKDKPEKIYLATDRGIFFSQNSGASWQRFNSQGLLNTDIQHIFISPKDKRIVCATKNGVFEFKENKWQALYQGLTANQVNFISEDYSGNLWLATDRGIFRTDEQVIKSALTVRPSETLDNFKNEPSIQEIQRKAIDYAEVSPTKIKSWRRLAQAKALMPEVSLDFDKTVTTALGSGYDRTQIGPQDWGVNLKWNVGELIWNNDQTSIDSRSKLMVELRDDILNEVTRLYFERRRLQTEVLLSPPQDKKEGMEKNLRLAELTASIDALTGGYLSRMLEKNK